MRLYRHPASSWNNAWVLDFSARGLRDQCWLLVGVYRGLSKRSASNLARTHAGKQQGTEQPGGGG